MDDGETKDTQAPSGATPALADTLAAGPVSQATPRSSIGRYQIVRQLGAGGMGVVWEAIDPELDRRVAIKLMREAVGSGGSIGDRLKREAQALAKLSHPNVVTVHDVGVAEGELYVVMQLVDGTTLDRYLAEASRSIDDVIALFLQAARGLAAAHGAGIVHRDFKPTNALVDREGTVRVSDFGLAHSTSEHDATAATGGALETAGLVGTPAYMAPEQFEGDQVTPATDQFSFCVALWEALYGRRPFAGEDVDTLRKAVVGGRRTEAPTNVRIPRRVQRVLARGLAVAPQDRFESMEALAAALAPRRRARLLGGAALVAIAGGLIATFAATRSHGDPCVGIEQPVDAVWNASRRDAIRAALGGDTAPAVLAKLDDRAARWRAMRRDACQATHVRHEQPEAELDRRYVCLDRSLRDMHAAIDILGGTIDAGLRVRAPDLARSGLDPQDCAAGSVPVAAPGRQDPAHLALYDEIAKARAESIAGHWAQVYALRGELGAKLDAVGDPELSARFYDVAAPAARQVGDAKTTMDLYQKAAETAVAAGLEDLAARQWSDLAELTAENGDLQGAERLLGVAASAAKHSGSPFAQVDVDDATASIAIDRGDFATAVASAKRALAGAQKLGSGMYVADYYARLANAQMEAGDANGAVDSMTHALAESKRDRGADHPSTISLIHHLAAAYETAGDSAHARPLWDQAQAGLERVFGPDSAPVMRLLIDRANSASPNGASSTPEALAAIERAIAIGDKILPPKDGQRGQLLEVLAIVHAGLHHRPETIEAYRRALAFYDSIDDPMGLARVLYNYGDALKESGKCDQAIPQFRRAATVAAKTGQRSRVQGAALGAVGTCLGRLGQREEAALEMKQAIDVLDEVGDILFAAQTRWELASLYVQLGNRPGGLELAREAADQLVGRPPPAEAMRAEILEWIKHPK